MHALLLHKTQETVRVCHRFELPPSPSTPTPRFGRLGQLLYVQLTSSGSLVLGGVVPAQVRSTQGGLVSWILQAPNQNPSKPNGPSGELIEYIPTASKQATRRCTQILPETTTHRHHPKHLRCDPKQRFRRDALLRGPQDARQSDVAP